MAAPARALAPTAEPEELRLTAHEAGRLLPVGDVVHVIGIQRDRWSRQRVREAMRTATRIRLTLSARSAGFGLSIDRAGEASLLIETDRNEVAAWLARQADRLTKE
ncbi:hypothetical protein [Methylobacterium brachiatum]|uniref:hypothetical protein n=1 Tax=Methylobacterium brachiatum TaxID=269660 RepID=UPI002446F064|nr:hypothetical protein [Methylobacterium brachiatum]MDH2313378.1 hypothetical protein [Methylobacterium brachiatum]